VRAVTKMPFYIPAKFMKQYLRTWVYFYVLSLVARKVCRHLHASVLNHTIPLKESKYFRSGSTLKVLKGTLFSSY